MTGIYRPWLRILMAVYFTKVLNKGVSMTNESQTSSDDMRDFLAQIQTVKGKLGATHKKLRSLLEYRLEQQHESDRGKGDVDNHEDIARLENELGRLDAELRDIDRADLTLDDVQSAWQLNDELERTLQSMSPSEMLFMPHADGTEFRPELIDEGPDAEIYRIKFPGRTDP